MRPADPGKTILIALDYLNESCPISEEVINAGDGPAQSSQPDNGTLERTIQTQQLTLYLSPRSIKS